MLYEYAITPEIFDASEYSSEEVCRLHLSNLKEVLLHEAIARDLRVGGWSKYLQMNMGRWHPSGKELIKKLSAQNRLVQSAVALSNEPVHDADWCEEALASRRNRLLHGIICGNSNAAVFGSEPEISSIHRLSLASWWKSRGTSVRLSRTIKDYLQSLDLILRHANSIMLIDPHINPNTSGYRDLIQLLRATVRPDVQPRIEIHRVIYDGSGAARKILSEQEIKTRFSDIEMEMKSSNIFATVFVWDDFHDRFLVSNLVGLSMTNGFDVTSDPHASVTLACLSRKDRDDIQREFDPASKRHELKFGFSIGVRSQTGSFPIVALRYE